ncbi:MarC family protein [Spongiibacter taiwanensis]|uniref:MarC family protein n=1 Tax=Spongiibacter taiwanensis TaxID=1748242 RepID=UPI002034FEA2|nr:MarC family protein [Spongiibacter taiwanensis]USA43701.1 MarC family protein [Spongiibacter taiwanensis]
MALSGLLESVSISVATFFAMVGPIDVAIMFAALSGGMTEAARRRAAIPAVLIATGILLAFALLGEWVLNMMGISLAALRTAGGVLLLLIGIELVSAKSSGATGATREETREAEQSEDISVFPLATPLIAGPGAIGAVILLMAHAEGHLLEQAGVVASLVFIMAITLVCLLLASQLQDRLGVTGAHMISRVFGVLLCALAVQFLFDGIAESGLLPAISPS